MRNFFLALFFFTSTSMFAQVPETQSPGTRVSIDQYRESSPVSRADRPQRRPWDRPSRDVAVPRGSVTPDYRDHRREDDRRWRTENRRRGWMRPLPRRRWDRYDPWEYRYVCTGPYVAWIGRVQVLIPGNCY